MFPDASPDDLFDITRPDDMSGEDYATILLAACAGRLRQERVLRAEAEHKVREYRGEYLRLAALYSGPQYQT